MRTDEPPTELPPSPLPAAPASVTIRVVAYIFFVYMFWPFVTTSVLAAVGFVKKPASSPTAEETRALTDAQLLGNGLAFPFQLLSILLLPLVTGVRLDQIGLTFRRLGRNCLHGAAGLLVIYPLCCAVHFVVILLHRLAGANVEEHPFEQLATQHPSALEWFLLVSTAIVTAPVLEEVLFRGALQSWLEERRWAPHIAMGLAVVTAAAMKGADMLNARSQGAGPLLLHLTPILFLLGLCVVFLAVWRFSRSSAPPAVFASSALFASVHSFAWPSPVALFLLALALGWLAQRARSLAGSIVLHALFNGVSCVLLFFPKLTLSL